MKEALVLDSSANVYDKGRSICISRPSHKKSGNAQRPLCLVIIISRVFLFFSWMMEHWWVPISSFLCFRAFLFSFVCTQTHKYIFLNFTSDPVENLRGKCMGYLIDARGATVWQQRSMNARPRASIFRFFF